MLDIPKFYVFWLFHGEQMILWKKMKPAIFQEPFSLIRRATPSMPSPLLPSVLHNLFSYKSFLIKHLRFTVNFSSARFTSMENKVSSKELYIATLFFCSVSLLRHVSPFDWLSQWLRETIKEALLFWTLSKSVGVGFNRNPKVLR